MALCDDSNDDSDHDASYYGVHNDDKIEDYEQAPNVPAGSVTNGDDNDDMISVNEPVNENNNVNSEDGYDGAHEIDVWVFKFICQPVSTNWCIVVKIKYGKLFWLTRCFIVMVTQQL